ncbi:excalibur calcium-binding domain protein [Pasteurella multocida]|uniref:Excalibur domain protein n=1 Tax=Pasteurella dagmatis ATCC 43325 TaxID=667128 RepID=C9PS17_9PAST|nr:excalibur calcium-binding domain-containing protein [Pasteurella dagmatis]EEX49744.1 excalibur domain protein [Pasteurella dagmatis ATCC 43325]SNV70796.1 excalibur calcium-binding domain protein [Pasteurella dagmatis]VEI57289.1 excalibur calcium-binding domain protein [Pasteurella multocida]
MKQICLLLLLSTLTFSSYAKRVSCKSFATQEQAQRYMERHNAPQLDGDGDGEACECLPGGSKYGSTSCRR